MNSKVLFLTNSFYSHSAPFISMAEELRKKNITIEWCLMNGNLDEYFELEEYLSRYYKVRSVNSLKPLWKRSEREDISLSSSEKEKRNKDFQVTFNPDYQTIKQQVQDIESLILRENYDLVITESSVHAATTAIEVLGIKSVYLNIFFMKPRLGEKAGVIDSIKTKLSALRDMKGVNKYRIERKLKWIFEFPATSKDLNIIPTYDFYIDYTPNGDSYFTGPIQWDKGLARRIKDDELFAFVKDQNVIFMSLGTTVKDEALFELVAEAVESTSFVLVVATGKQNKPSLDKFRRTLAREWLPYSELLKYASIVVTHGGMNSTLSIVKNGVPAIVVPYFGDQFSHADQLVRMNIAKKLPRKDIRVDSFLKTLQSVEEEKCRVYSKEFARRASEYGDVQWAVTQIFRILQP